MQLIDFILHVDEHLDTLLKTYGTATYGIIALIIFMETGLVVTPILPGDSLLFAGGMFAARGALNVHLLFLVLTAAAILGDNTNYWIGRTIGPRVLKNENSGIFKKSYLDKTHGYFEQYGSFTFVIARLVLYIWPGPCVNTPSSFTPLYSPALSRYFQWMRL